MDFENLLYVASVVVVSRGTDGKGHKILLGMLSLQVPNSKQPWLYLLPFLQELHDVPRMHQNICKISFEMLGTNFHGNPNFKMCVVHINLIDRMEL